MPTPGTRLLALVALLVLPACQSAGSVTAFPSPSTPSPSTASSPEPTPAAYAGADAVIAMAPGPRGVAWADGAVWVASTRADVVQRVDPTTNEVSAEVAVGARPVTLVTLNGELWVSVLNGESADDDEVVRIDTGTNTVDLRVQVPVHHNIAAGAGAIWVLDASGSLRRIDPATGALSDAVASGPGPVALAANDSAAFGIRSDRTVWRWPMAGGELQEAALDAGVPGRSRVAASNAGLWIAVPGLVVALEPDSLAARAELSLPEMSLVNDLFVTDSDVWLSANVVSEELGLDGGSVLRLDPETLEVRQTFRLGPESSGVMVADASVWAVDQADDRLARFPLTAAR